MKKYERKWSIIFLSVSVTLFGLFLVIPIQDTFTPIMIIWSTFPIFGFFTLLFGIRFLYIENSKNEVTI